MLKVCVKNKFTKDVRKMQKRGKRLNKLHQLMNELVREAPLDRRFLDHPLRGDCNGSRECHLEPDWVLIYMISADIITFVRTGSHADLFR